MSDLHQSSTDPKEATNVLERWLERKTLPGSTVNRLVGDIAVPFELNLRRHSSSFAFVRFICVPSAVLSYSSSAQWPETLDTSYEASLEQTIENAVVDTLMPHFVPFFGCRLTLQEIRWDEIRSSEMAFYEASCEAMNHLIDAGRWMRERL